MVRTHPQWIRAVSLVRNGTIGELRSMVGAFSYFNDDPGNIRNVPAFGGGALMDIGAKESLPLIQKAFEEDRVDEMFVQMIDVEEHFGLPLTSPRKFWAGTEREQLVYAKGGNMPGPEAGLIAEAEAAARRRDPQMPYVAANKVGRNDPCPCGSGKKYKKCCGA